MNNQEIRDRNLQTVARYYQAERDRDLSTWATFWRADGRQVFATLGDAATVAGIDDLIEGTRTKFETRPPYGIAHRIMPFEDPTQIFVELTLDYADRPDVVLWCIFTFDADGLIAQINELYDRGLLPARTAQ